MAASIQNMYISSQIWSCHSESFRDMTAFITVIYSTDRDRDKTWIVLFVVLTKMWR